MSTQFTVPTREQQSENNLPTYDAIKNGLGFVPNLFATLGLSDNGLQRYISFQNDKSSLSNKEKEVVNLVVSEVNNCKYCKAAHTAIGKMNGFTNEQALELRSGKASFNEKYNALVKLAQNITETRGHIDQTLLENFISAGYDQGNLVDLILQVGEKTITNYLHSITLIPIDFPEVSSL
ncbi:MAG: carboxymuconolactone decarboxylase family protein [Ferruginibacter sp.]|nr:carboxymuconolactone decarboxylase family protein [Ferruginibacter sp.]